MNEVNMDVPIDKMFGSYIFFIWIFFLIIECIILKVSFSRECGINFQKERVQQMQKSVQLYREHSTTVMNVPLFVVLNFYSSTNAKWNGKGTRERQKKKSIQFLLQYSEYLTKHWYVCFAPPFVAYRNHFALFAIYIYIIRLQYRGDLPVLFIIMYRTK